MQQLKILSRGSGLLMLFLLEIRMTTLAGVPAWVDW